MKPEPEFEEVKPMYGIRCHMNHKNLPENITAFPGTLLDHMKRWHPDIYRETITINEKNRKYAAKR
jgi:hypothetical protein